jgi:hypothetical protein
MAKRKPKTHYVVWRQLWKEASRHDVRVRVPGDVRMGTFPTAEDAEVEVARLEADARSKVDPFACGIAWSDRTSMPESVYRDFLRDADVEPPEGEEWSAWFKETAPKLRPEQIERIWEGLDRLRFYRYEERPLRPVAYAVVDLHWRYNDMWFYPSEEGGNLVAAYRSRERAEAEAEKLSKKARKEWRARLDRSERYDFDMERRRFSEQGPFDPRRKPPKRSYQGEHSGHFAVNEVPFFEVVEFELEDEA